MIMTDIKLELKDKHWQCGDGCCDDYLTMVIVNDEIIDTFSFFQDEDILIKLVDYLNNEKRDMYYFKTNVCQSPQKGYEFRLMVDYEKDLGEMIELSDEFIYKFLKATGINFTFTSCELNWEKYYDEDIIQEEVIEVYTSVNQ